MIISYSNLHTAFVNGKWFVVNVLDQVVSGEFDSQREAEEELMDLKEAPDAP